MKFDRIIYSIRTRRLALRRSRWLSQQSASSRNIYPKKFIGTGPPQNGVVRNDTTRYSRVARRRLALSLSHSASLPLCFTFTKLMLVVVPSMSTSTVLASKVSSWSWLRFSPAISTNDSPTTVGLIAVYLYVWCSPSVRLAPLTLCMSATTRSCWEPANEFAVGRTPMYTCVRVWIRKSPPRTARALLCPVTRSVSMFVECPDFLSAHRPNLPEKVKSRRALKKCVKKCLKGYVISIWHF